MSDASQSLVGPSDIAKLAGVSRGAVSNWRRRYTDFPPKAGGSEANPLFALDTVLKWLDSRGTTIEPGVEEALWAALNGVRGHLSPDQIAQLTLTIACAAKVSQRSLARAADGVPTAEVLHEALQLLIARDLLTEQAQSLILQLDAKSLEALAAAVEEVPANERADACDRVLERISRTQLKLGTDLGFVASRSSNMLASLMDLRPDARIIYDPACGSASALLSIGMRRSGSQLFGQEISEQLALIARQRAYLRDLDLEVRIGDTLRTDLLPDLRADAIVLEPPFGMRFSDVRAIADPRYLRGTPPKSSADFAWIQHAIAHLNDDGLAFVVTPMGALERSGSERTIRERLIGDGCVRSVVALPGRLNPQTSISLALWVLQAARTDAGSVLIIDAGEYDSPERDLAAWLERGAREIPVPHAEISTLDLIKDGAILTPKRWVSFVEPTSSDLNAGYGGALRAVRKSVAAARDLETGLSSPPRTALSRPVSLGELADQGFVSIRVGVSKAGGGERGSAEDLDLLRGCVTAKDVRNGVLPPRPSSLPVGEDTTQAGDVLVITWNRISVVVDVEGGHTFASGVSRIRVEDRGMLNPEYLANMLLGAWNERFISGTTVQRINLKEFEIPLPPLADQDQFVEAAVRAQELRRQATIMGESASELENTLRSAVRYGVLLDGNAQDPAQGRSGEGIG